MTIVDDFHMIPFNLIYKSFPKMPDLFLNINEDVNIWELIYI